MNKRPLGRTGLGIAVAGEIHEVEPILDRKPVDQAGPAGGPRRARQAGLPDERVDEARLADVGAADHDDLWQRRRRKVRRLGRRRDEAGAYFGHGWVLG